MDLVADPLLELENRPPLPQACEQIDVGAGLRLDDRYALLLAHLVFLCKILDLLFIVRRIHAIRFLAEILLADEVPSDHESEHEHAPEERDDDPDQFDPFDRLIPPDALSGRCHGHFQRSLSRWVCSSGYAGIRIVTFISPRGSMRLPSRPR